ncbi:MAG: Uncharacterized MFS-type transporter [uncultured Paraburkholderia sp.]|nr:MAG: Uncharacterized MFS-type transporter [uncultured Paraburkholderia sp.]CAH2921630.1 MAG: Uncharacterized MFS-type transporter [uncultured Paraburkholderia sp.]
MRRLRHDQSAGCIAARRNGHLRPVWHDALGLAVGPLLNSRVLLFWYYGLRGLSLMYLPHAFGIDFFGLPLFAVF